MAAAAAIERAAEAFLDLMAAEPEGSCEYCGERDAVTEVDLSDPGAGYVEFAQVCAECAYEMRHGVRVQ